MEKQGHQAMSWTNLLSMHISVTTKTLTKKTLTTLRIVSCRHNWNKKCWVTQKDLGLNNSNWQPLLWNPSLSLPSPTSIPQRRKSQPNARNSTRGSPWALPNQQNSTSIPSIKASTTLRFPEFTEYLSMVSKWSNVAASIIDMRPLLETHKLSVLKKPQPNAYTRDEN